MRTQYCTSYWSTGVLWKVGPAAHKWYKIYVEATTRNVILPALPEYIHIHFANVGSIEVMIRQGENMFLWEQFFDSFKFVSRLTS